MVTAVAKDESETIENDESIAQMQEILRQQAEVNVLRPAGSRRYRDWRGVPTTRLVWPIQTENNACLIGVQP